MCYPAGVSSTTRYELEIRIRRLTAAFATTAVNHREVGGGGGGEVGRVKKQCVCSPTIHPGSFRCRHHHSEYLWVGRQGVSAEMTSLRGMMTSASANGYKCKFATRFSYFRISKQYIASADLFFMMALLRICFTSKIQKINPEKNSAELFIMRESADHSPRLCGMWC
ncbi:hypothetical protein LXL04_008486 [Taraxacum kok-saghyz]